jgi:CBS-domain-containing membrane protein
MKMYPTIKNIMTSNPVTLTDDKSVSHIIEKMKKNEFDHLPVVDRWNTLLGIISKTDLYKKALSLSQETSGKSYTSKVLFVTSARDIMTPNPVVVTPEHTVDYAIELLLQGDFHALPVVEDSKVIGIITSKDVLEFMIDKKVLAL